MTATPFQWRRAAAPGIASRALLADQCVSHPDQEDQEADARDICPDRRDEIPSGECIGIVGVAARHSRQTEEVHREERHVDADEGQPEMQPSPNSEYM